MLTLALQLLLVTPAHAEDKTYCTTVWKNIRHANDDFEEKKDLRAGKKLYELLPHGRTLLPNKCPKYSETIEALYRDTKFRDELLAKGDDFGFQINFRMINVSDGAFAEELDINLGKTIEKYPQKFLKYLKAEHGDTYCPDGLMGNTGEYDQDASVDNKIIKTRVKALESVKDTSLAKIKASCLKTLNKLFR